MNVFLPCGYGGGWRGNRTPKNLPLALNDYSVSRTLFRTTLIVVHLVTVGRIWIKSFIFLLNRRVNSSLYEWVGWPLSNPGLVLETRKVVWKLQRYSDLKPGIPVRKDSLLSVIFFFFKVFHSVCHWLSGYLGFNPRKQRHADFSKFLPDFL